MPEHKCELHEVLVQDFKELKHRVQTNEDSYKPLIPQIEEMIAYRRADKTSEHIVVIGESMKSFHKRLDKLSKELEDHMEEEERMLKEAGTTRLKVGLFIFGYLIAFAIFVSTSYTEVKLMKQDIDYIKKALTGDNK